VLYDKAKKRQDKLHRKKGISHVEIITVTLLPFFVMNKVFFLPFTFADEIQIQKTSKKKVVAKSINVVLLTSNFLTRKRRVNN
jgi:hypothetical protein